MTLQKRKSVPRGTQAFLWSQKAAASQDGKGPTAASFHAEMHGVCLPVQEEGE